MSKFGVCVLYLGYTRLAGLLVYDSASRAFIETKPNDAKKLIAQGELYGVVWNKEEECFYPDPNFGMDDILVKSGVGNYRSLCHEVPGVRPQTSYMVVRVLETNKGKLYEVVSNTCQRVKVLEKNLRDMLKMGNVGGVKLADDGSIGICEGVVIQNREYPENAQIVELPLNVESAVKQVLDDRNEQNEDAGKEIDKIGESLSSIFDGLEDSEEEEETPAEVVTPEDGDEKHEESVEAGPEEGEKSLAEVFEAASKEASNGKSGKKSRKK